MQRNTFQWLLVIATIVFLSGLLLGSSVGAQSSDVADVVDAGTPGSGVVVISADDLGEGDVVVIPVQDSDPIKEYAYIIISAVLTILLILDRGRFVAVVTNALDKTYEALPLRAGDMMKQMLDTGIQMGRDLVTNTPGTLDDAILTPLLDRLSNDIIAKLERDGRLPYPEEDVTTFVARRASVASATEDRA